MKITQLTDKNLFNKTLELVSKEREILSQVLMHLQEMERRKLYSDHGCGSLFEYCVKILKYSESQASRRVSAVRVLAKTPEVASKIERGELNLSQLNLANQFFSQEKINDSADRMRVLGLIENQSVRESQKKLDDLKHKPGPQEVKINISEETYRQLQKIQRWKSRSTLDRVIYDMAVEVEKIWDPEIVQRQRTPTAGQSRYVSVQAKAEVWRQSEGKCEKCGSTRNLEIDHIRPYGVGGKTVAENLRLLCHNCNQRARIKFYGLKSKFV